MFFTNFSSKMTVSFIKNYENVKTKTMEVKSNMGRKAKWNWLKDFKTVQHWLRKVRVERTGSEKTIAMYLKRFGPFINWVKMTPDELVTEAERQEKAGNKKWAEEKAIEYFDYLTRADEGPKLARTTAQTSYGAIRSFFRHNDIIFYGKTPQATIMTRTKLPSREDLLKVWKSADIDEKQALSILRSGFRPEDAVALTYGDVKEDYESGADRLYIEKVSEKEDLWFAVYLTKEATDITRLKLEQRKKAGEVFNDNTPLISRQRELGKPISTDMLWRIVKGAGERVGVKLMPKMFRKWFRTNASPVIGRDATMKMGGWTIPGVGRHYFLPSKKECLKNFLRMERLLLFEEPRRTELETEKQRAITILEKAGVDWRVVLRSRKVKTTEEEVRVLNEIIGELLKVKKEPIGGGLPFELQARKALADILYGAVEDVKKRLAEKS